MLVDIEPLLDKCKEIYNSRTPFAASLIIREMEKAKVVDAEEVKHGKWKAYGLMNPQCSLCNKYNIERSCRCPNCGAKMDGVNRE